MVEYEGAAWQARGRYVAAWVSPDAPLEAPAAAGNTKKTKKGKANA